MRPEDWLDHETWVRDCFAHLGDIRGKRALDYGCGQGPASVVLSRMGARVAAFDLAADRVRAARDLAEASGEAQRVHFAVMAAEALAYRAGAFDTVYGNAILHHVNLAAAAPELRRVLKPGGVAVFAEPLGHNPILEFARRHLPYPGKARDPQERPLRYADLETLGRVLPLTRVREHQLLSMLRRVIGNAGIRRILEVTDACLLEWFPFLRRWCRYVVVVARKPHPGP
jgi:2-polyprenyl-3-methyl-5-hydroxy-6-metoxy-1,4-benzoquinol methylase